MDNEYNSPNWEYCVFAGVKVRRQAGAPDWQQVPSSGVKGAVYYDDDNSNNGHGATSSTGYNNGMVLQHHSRHGPVESPSMASPALVSTRGDGSSTGYNNGVVPPHHSYHGPVESPWVASPVGVPMGWDGGSTGYNNGVAPHPYSRHGLVEGPSMASPVGIQTGWYGGSSSFTHFAQPYQAVWHSGGNSYNAQPRAMVGSGRAPRAQLRGDAAAREVAERLMSDPRHGTVAPKTKRLRKRLTRQVKKDKEAEAAKAAVVWSETGGDGVTSSSEPEDDEKEEAGHAGYDIANGHVESQGLAEGCLISDDQAAARRKALLDEEAVCEASECDVLSEASTDMSSRKDSFESQDKVDDFSRALPHRHYFSKAWIESQQEDAVPGRMRSPSNAHSISVEEAEADLISCAPRPLYFGSMPIRWDGPLSCWCQGRSPYFP
jgi:hypothetical protein